MRWCLMLLLACGSSGSETEEPERVGPVSEGSEGSEEVGSEGGQSLAIRIELENPTMPANGDPSTDTAARLDAVLYVRNTGLESVTIDMAIPAAFELTWTLTADDGRVWQPTFLPPPMPRPGGPPRTELNVAPGGEARIADLHGISGFYVDDPTGWGPLPAGGYDVVVSGVRLGDDAIALTASAVRLEVR